jgi:hypothetical protein
VADRAHLLSDEDLLGALAASFPVEPVEPDPALLHQLSLAVAELRQKTAPAPAPARSPAATRPLRWTLPRRLSPALFAGAVIGVVGAGTGISYAVGVPIPAAVRSIARSVGLAQPARPTTPPGVRPTATAPSPTAAVSAVRQAESTLHQALSSHPPLSVISHDSTVLAHRLAQVGGHPVARAGGTTANGQRLLHEACRQLEGSAPAGTGSATTHAGTNGVTFPGCGAVGAGDAPAGSTSTPSTFPSSTTRTTEVPSAAHPGAGTGDASRHEPVGGSSGTHTGGTPTGGTTGTTTPGTSPDHYQGGSSRGRPGPGPSSGSQTHLGGHANATNPRSGATSD